MGQVRLQWTIALAAFGPLAVTLSGADDGKLREDAKGQFGIIEAAPADELSKPDVTLGRALFWDKRISGDGKTACASCHPASDWGADSRQFSVDARGKETARNAQTVFNAVRQPSLRWTGDRKSGAHQAEKSLTGSMGFDTPEAAISLLKSAGYENAFRTAFPKEEKPMTAANYAKAIAAYEATLLTPAPFDRFLAGDDAALTTPQKAGLKVFLSTGCADCHNGPLLGGSSIQTFGVTKPYWAITRSAKRDAGLFEVTKNEADRYKFRTSMLRNIANTAPYFHDGSVANLTDAVHAMADLQLGAPLSATEADAIVAFLQSLTGPAPTNYSAPDQKPNSGSQ